MGIANSISLSRIDPYREGVLLAAEKEEKSAPRSTVERVAKAALSLLALHPSFHLPFSLLMGVKQIQEAKGAEKWLAIGNFSLSLLHRQLGATLAVTRDLMHEIEDLYASKEAWEVCHHSLKISHSLLYLAMRIRGGFALYFFSSLSMAAVSLANAAREFKKDRWIEAGAELITATVRIHEISKEWHQLKKMCQIEPWLRSIFAYFSANQEAGDRSNYGNSTLLSDLFIDRHSGTQFDEKPLSQEQILALVQAARWTPSSYNDQPWNFIFCDRNQHPEAYEKVIDSIYGQEWVEKAPLLIISVVRPQFTYNQKDNLWAQYDTGAAALSLSLQATALGLMSHQIGGFDPQTIQESFHLPQGYQPLSIIAVGYESTPLDPEEAAGRIRRPESENFFFGEWGSSFPYFFSKT